MKKVTDTDLANQKSTDPDPHPIVSGYFKKSDPVDRHGIAILSPAFILNYNFSFVLYSILRTGNSVLPYPTHYCLRTAVQIVVVSQYLTFDSISSIFRSLIWPGGRLTGRAGRPWRTTSLPLRVAGIGIVFLFSEGVYSMQNIINSLNLFASYSKLSWGTHTWKLLNLQTFLLRMPLWKKNKEI